MEKMHVFPWQPGSHERAPYKISFTLSARPSTSFVRLVAKKDGNESGAPWPAMQFSRTQNLTLFVSHFLIINTWFYLIIFVQRSIKLLFLLFFLKNERSVQATSSDSALVCKIAHFDVDFTAVGVVLVSAGFFSSTECFSRHSSHWNIQKRDESRQTLAVLSPKPRNGWSHFKRPSILLAQDFQVCERPGRTSECSSPQAGAKIAFPSEYARDLVVCLIIPSKLLLAQISDRSLRWFVVLLALLSHFLVARATRNCRYSSRAQR